jgi:hypothetical protein
MITQDDIKKCWRPEDVITLITQKRKQLKKKITSTSTWRFSDVNALIDNVFGVEDKK